MTDKEEPSKRIPSKRVEFMDTVSVDDPEQNLILYLGIVLPEQIEAVKKLKQITGAKYRIGLLTDKKTEIPKEIERQLDVVLRESFHRFTKIEALLMPYQKQIATIINRLEHAMPLYARIIPLFPYLKNPTPRSIRIANDKIRMRKTLKKYAPESIPKFTIVNDATEKTLKHIETDIGFPVVIKPASLAQSKLVSVCFYREELETQIKDAFKKIKSIYKNAKVEQEPKILVEQLMEGEMFSIDGYVNEKGKITFTPMIEIKTGRDKGYDDFFLYSQMTPTTLEPADIAAAQEAAAKAIYAFGIRSCSAHVEMYKTKTGWKIVEIGSRVGGFREEILGFAFGIKHHVNDILIRLGMNPSIKPTKKKHCVLLKFWPRTTGKLKSVLGFKKICEEKFVVQAIQQKKPGDKISPAKYGDPPTVMLYLVADTRVDLLGNIRKVEQAIDIVVE